MYSYATRGLGFLVRCATISRQLGQGRQRSGGSPLFMLNIMPSNNNNHHVTVSSIVRIAYCAFPIHSFLYYLCSYEATCCIKFAVLEAHWVKVNSIVLAFRYPSSLRNKTKKSKECPKLPLFTLPRC